MDLVDLTPLADSGQSYVEREIRFYKTAEISTALYDETNLKIPLEFYFKSRIFRRFVFIKRAVLIKLNLI